MRNQRLLSTDEAGRLVNRTPAAIRKQIERSATLRGRLQKDAGGRWLIPESVLPEFGIVVAGHGSYEAMLTAGIVETMLTSREQSILAALPRDIREAHARAAALEERLTDAKRAQEESSARIEKLEEVAADHHRLEQRNAALLSVTGEAIALSADCLTLRALLRRRRLRRRLLALEAACEPLLDAAGEDVPQRATAAR